MILWSKSIFILVILALCLVAMAVTFQAYRPGSDPAKFKKKLNLGLDLQGGMYLDLEVDTKAAVTRVLDRLSVSIEDAMLDKQVDFETVERRQDRVEVVLPEGEKVDWNKPPFERLTATLKITPEGANRYIITLPPEEALRIQKNAASQALEVLRNRIDSLGVSEPSIQRKGEREIIVQLPGVKDRQSALNAIGTQAVLEFYLVEQNVTPATMDLAKHVVKYQETRDETTKKITDRIPYVLRKRPELSGDTIRDARVRFGQFNTPYVAMSFDSIGTDRFGKITSRNRGRQLAIVLDDKVKSAPVIQDAITGGEAQITGRFSLQEATELTIWLRSGALPAPLTIREERTVGASLGEDSIRQGITSLAVGGLLVMLFMLIYYRVPGAFAASALIFNLLIILSVLAFFSATLTLPGIAGIVLTMGMSVDANVLIFERIREEIAVARNVRAAINEGFQKAFWTIFDANITTLGAALALLFFGSGPIKGFAVTLSIGIMASMFTAIFVTRFLFELFYLRKQRIGEFSI